MGLIYFGYQQAYFFAFKSEYYATQAVSSWQNKQSEKSTTDTFGSLYLSTLLDRVKNLQIQYIQSGYEFIY